MSRNFVKRYVLLALLGAAVVAVLATAVLAYRSIVRRGPMQHQIISLEKQDDWQAFAAPGSTLME